MTIPFSTNSNMIISKYAVEGLRKIFKKGINYKKAGSNSNGFRFIKKLSVQSF